MQTKHLVISIVIALLLIGGAMYFSSGGGEAPGARYPGTAYREPTQVQTASSTVENGVQYIDILARGGYTPETTKATAGMPTVMRVRTENTFDCSSALVIPALGFSDYLERTGTREIQIPAEKAQGTLKGLCSMGMYTFQIVFE